MSTGSKMTWNSGRAFILCTARTARGWSQNDLAKLAGVSRRSVSAAESGMPEVGCAFFAAVCSVLDLAPEKFVSPADQD